MAHRRIGQEVFRFGTKAERQTSLDELGALIDWSLADEVLASLYPAPKGEKAWPPLAMFKALLLATWHDLSDVALFEALSDRASFRRFCGFSGDEATPERTAFVRFRRLLVAHGLDRRLFEAIARDLESKGAAVRKGTSPQSLTAIASLIDATVIGSAGGGDKEAAWVKPTRTRASSERSRPLRPMSPMSQLLLRSSLMSRARFMPTKPMMRFRSKRRLKPRVEPQGFCARAIAGCRPKSSKRTTVRCGPFVPRSQGSRQIPSLSRREEFCIPCSLARIEKIFGTWKRSYHFRSMRWLGLVKARLQVHLATIAYNVKRDWRRQMA